MTEPLGGLRRTLPLAFVAIVAVGTLVGIRLDLGPGAGPAPAATSLHADLAELGRGRVLVGFDADIGTYAEIRPAVRAALAQLVRGGATISMVSYTPEGRALALAELDRLRRGGVEPGRLLDLGFHAGAEAGLVAGVSSIVPREADGALAAALRDAGAGIGAFDAVLVVGGNDLGPRSWVEQVATRLPEVAIFGIVPTSLLPQAVPYRASGQLAGLVAGAREVAAYVAAVRDDPTTGAVQGAAQVTDEPPSSLPVLVGLLLTLVLLAEAIASRWRAPARGGAA
ncbi:MAG: hypothetical protein ABI622_01220 [Chloroflexota bacterium]